ncbi:MAG: hypothetical protein MK212_08425 [Saprospiraceae bacterium]|nr:hypothetical protein [Saprospiraceae bacterium]
MKKLSILIVFLSLLATIYFAGALAGNAVQASPSMGVGFFYKWNQG